MPLLYIAVIDLCVILDVDVPLICALITAVYRILTFIEKRFDQRETRHAPAFRALGVCEHICPFTLRDIWATLLSPKWAENFVAQMVGDETSLPPLVGCYSHGGFYERALSVRSMLFCHRRSSSVCISQS